MSMVCGGMLVPHGLVGLAEKRLLRSSSSWCNSPSFFGSCSHCRLITEWAVWPALPASRFVLNPVERKRSQSNPSVRQPVLPTAPAPLPNYLRFPLFPFFTQSLLAVLTLPAFLPLVLCSTLLASLCVHAVGKSGSAWSLNDIKKALPANTKNQHVSPFLKQLLLPVVVSALSLYLLARHSPAGCRFIWHSLLFQKVERAGQWEFDPKKLKNLKPIGSGNFGKVCSPLAVQACL